MRTTHNIDPSQWPELWQAAYRVLEQSITPEKLRRWIQPLELMETVQNEGRLKIYFAAPNDFYAQWVRDYHQKELENAFTQVTGRTCEVFFSVKDGVEQVQVPGTYHQTFFSGDGPTTPQVASNPMFTDSRDMSAVGTVNRGNAPRGAHENTMDPRQRFENFVVGASNQFAHATAVAVAEHPAKQYNPLFLYSQPGLGKTHLLHAIGNRFIQRNPGARVAYLSAERFMNELIESLQHQKMPQFRTKYRDSYDMILIDDIQFIAGKQKTEEEFFHTFNALHSSKRQIVVTSDRPPKEIQGLEERIRTRFEWGLVADIQPPEIETRIAILKTKAERDDIYLPDDVATFLASHIRTNVRELEGILIKLQAQASLTGAEISLEMAKHELKMSVPEESSHMTVESIQAAVAKHFHVKVQDLKSNTRTKNFAEARQIAMYLIRKYTGMAFNDIGQYFGGRDHSTVMHACKKVEGAFESDASFQDALESIQNSL